MFTRYTALGLARFGPGAVLQLSAAQAAARAHVLDTLDAQAGHYRARAAVEFKRGESIGLAEQPARNMSETLVPVDAAATADAATADAATADAATADAATADAATADAATADAATADAATADAAAADAAAVVPAGRKAAPKPPPRDTAI
jgi:hypothetical protein